MGYYWKYTRSGRFSRGYISFIIDVLPNSISNFNGNVYWQTSIEEIEAFLILLQDVEVLNNPSLGIQKPAFAQVVRSLGFNPTGAYKISGQKYVYSHAVMGTHSGSPLPWGYICLTHNPISVNITGLLYSAFPNSNNGQIPFHSDDKLVVFRNHPDFISQGQYWDYMPMHSCLNTFINALLMADRNRALLFITNVLKWI